MPKTIKLSQLGEACYWQRTLFKEKFGDEVKVSVALARRVAKDFDWDWAADHLLSAPALAEYNKVRDLAWAEYKKVRDLAWADYNKVRDLARADYNKVRDLARADYQKVRDLAWADYKKVCDLAWADYQKVCAVAFAKAYLTD